MAAHATCSIDHQEGVGNDLVEEHRLIRVPEEYRVGLTRREFARSALAAPLALAGCGARAQSDTVGSDGRLVTLDSASAGLALLLRRVQAGTVPFVAEDPIIDAIEAFQREPVRNLANAAGELNLERLAMLHTDMVVGLASRGLPVTSIQKLASCRTVNPTGRLPRDAEALGVAMGAPADRLKRQINGVRDQCDRLARLVTGGTTPSISVLSPGLDGSSLYILGGSTPAGHVLNNLGIELPPAQKALMSEPVAFQEVSLERVDAHDADMIVLLTGPSADPQFLRAQPVWSSLRAVKAGSVVMADAFRWSSLASLIDAAWVVDDLDVILRTSTAPPVGIATPAGLARIDRYRELG